MGLYSHNYHIQADHAAVVDGIICWIADQGWLPEVIAAPQASDLADSAAGPTAMYLVGPTDPSGWTEIWSAWDAGDEGLVAFLSMQSQCRALYGHDNDRCDNWRWIHFERGQVVAGYWFTGQLWVRFPRLAPAEAATLWAAFAEQDRTYSHMDLLNAFAQLQHTQSAACTATLVRAEV